jgi:PiT family inorganic phosphate transporter
LLTWYLGIPSSSSHALIGGLLGAAIIENGFDVVKVAGLGKVIFALAASPIIGFVIGYLVMKIVLFLARPFPPSINTFFKRIQIITAVLLALSHGTNDSQKTMGVITLSLVSAGVLKEFHVPIWVVTICASAIAFGTWVGGWRLIRTLGGKFFKIRPIHGFTTQITSATVILGAALLGGPVSTTQVVSSAIMGIGSAERISKVRWGVASQIVMTWLTTIPAVGLMAALIALVLRQWF